MHSSIWGEDAISRPSQLNTVILNPCLNASCNVHGVLDRPLTARPCPSGHGSAQPRLTYGARVSGVRTTNSGEPGVRDSNLGLKGWGRGFRPTFSPGEKKTYMHYPVLAIEVRCSHVPGCAEKPLPTSVPSKSTYVNVAVDNVAVQLQMKTSFSKDILLRPQPGP